MIGLHGQRALALLPRFPKLRARREELHTMIDELTELYGTRTVFWAIFVAEPDTLMSASLWT